MKPRLLVDLVTDFVCPWCYVGLKSWHQAKAMLSDDFDVITRYRPYELNPGIPDEGIDRRAHYDRKFPDTEKRNAMMEHLIKAADNIGAPFDPMAPKWLPNTMAAHRILRWAHFEALHEGLAERLYTAFWLEGADIGDHETLIALGTTVGLDPEQVRQDLKEGKDNDLVFNEAQAMREAGVRGVPTFIVSERHGFAGALPPAELEQQVRQAAALQG